MYSFLLSAALLFTCPLALAAGPLDDDDLLGDEDDDSKSEEDRMADDDNLDLLEEEEEFDFDDEEEETDDLLGEEGEAPPGQIAGADTAALFRAQQDLANTLSTDEAVQSWEIYLEQYPNTVFSDRIAEIIDNLMSELYDSSEISTKTIGDALTEEIFFSQSLLLENLNPRSKIQAGFEWGLPDYVNLIVDYEHALARNFSVHGGIRHRYTGWNLETGGRMALHKSLRTQSILTVIGDLHFNTNPAFVGIRPQLAYGQRIGKLDVQAQAGIDLELRTFAGLRVIGGVNLTYRAAETVALFLESNLNMKNFEWENGPFRFNVVTFGLKFFPSKSKANIEDLEINMGTSVPYTSNYWMYHYGSIMVQTNYYL